MLHICIYFTFLLLVIFYVLVFIGLLIGVFWVILLLLKVLHFILAAKCFFIALFVAM